MPLFTGEPLAGEPEDQPAAPKPPTKRELERRRTSRGFDLQASYARAREETTRIRRERFERWGIDPDHPDAEALWQAEEQRRNLLVQQGWTFIRGRQERWEDWDRDRRAEEAAAIKAPAKNPKKPRR